MKIAFLGLGVMGYPMAGHLAVKGGHDLVVYNRSGAKAQAWVKAYQGKGGQVAAADTPAKAAAGAQMVFCCVGDDPDVRAVALGTNGAYQSMDKGSLFVDHTTASAQLAQELESEARKRGIQFLDAPVSGGQAGAENGALTVMVGGEAEIELVVHHGLAAVLHLPGLRRALGDHLQHLVCVQARFLRE